MACKNKDVPPQATTSPPAVTAGLPETGDARLEALRAALAQFDRPWYARSEDQRHMHRVWTTAALRGIYGGEEYEEKREALARRFEFEAAPPSCVSMSAPRGAGKTDAMAMWIAAFLRTQRKSRITVLTPGMRSTQQVRSKVLVMLSNLEVESGRAPPVTSAPNDIERLVVRNAWGDESTAYFYPCSSKLRMLSPAADGEYATIAMMENANFIREDVLMHTVASLALQKDAVFLSITQPGTSPNPVWEKISKMRTERGESVFREETYTAAPFLPLTMVRK